MDKKSIKLLSIGNSFSRDSLYFLPGFLREANYDEIIIAYLAVGGCSIEQHFHKALDKSLYGYMKNTDGSWVSSQIDMDTGLADEDWDYIIFHQSTVVSGCAFSMTPYIDYLTKYIKARCSNPEVKFFWNMTWTYSKYFSKNAFLRYNRDQMKMHRDILDVTKNTILSRPEFTDAIPTGTAFMNFRTSYFGDNVNEDGLHASLYVGRYLAAMVFACYFTGLKAENFGKSYYPEYSMYFNLDAMREAADNAIASPYDITPSKITRVPSLKVLSVGDGRALDSVCYLYDFLSEKLDNVTVASFIADGNSGEYRKTNEEGTTLSCYSLAEVIADEKWDVIAYSGDCVDVENKSYTVFLDTIKSCSQNPHVKVLWNMTWAYQNGYSLPGFEKYSNDRSVMYEAILDSMKNEILPSSDFLGIIPSGVTVEIMRSSYLGDTFTEDGVRLADGLAKYGVSLTFAGYLLGIPVRRLFFMPEEHREMLESDGRDIACDAIYYAFRQPYNFRASKYVELVEKGLDGNFGDK
ncbi:MAG: DUF4886 domain-containing protein [Clostridia bacterium]|nr:DUF4886 domain-containing protein [Clostridia bacterium]